MQHLVQSWIAQGRQLRTNLEAWATAINNKNPEHIAALYHPKARLFPTFGSLKKSPAEVQNYFAQADIFSVSLNYHSLSYHTDERLVEGEYTFRFISGDQVNASFAFKFSAEGLILEHASAPKNLNSWRVRNEVNICTLLTSSTVQSILKRDQVLQVTA